MVVGRHDFYWQIRGDDRTYDLCQVHERVVLIADVPYLIVDLLVRELEQPQVYTAHVVDVQVGPLLIAAEDPDAPLVDREIGQDVHDHIEPLPRRVAANRGGTKRAGGESRLAL